MSVPAAYLGVILIWSTTPLGIKWSSEDGNFLFALAGRMVIGVAVCYLLLALLRMPMPWHASARRTFLAAGLGIFGAMTATYWGSQYVSSGLISVIFGLSPLFTSVLAYVVLNERSLTPGKLGGIVLGFLGLIIVFGASWSVSDYSGRGVAAVLVAVVIQCMSLVWIKRFDSDMHALQVTTGALTIVVPLVVLTWWLGAGSLSITISDRAAWSIVYLGIFGSVVGFALYFYIIKRLPTGTISLITLITPVTALILGVILNDEQISSALVWGTFGILGGLIVHQWGDVVLRRVQSVLLD